MGVGSLMLENSGFMLFVRNGREGRGLGRYSEEG